MNAFISFLLVIATHVGCKSLNVIKAIILICLNVERFSESEH